MKAIRVEGWHTSNTLKRRPPRQTSSKSFEGLQRNTSRPSQWSMSSNAATRYVPTQRPTNQKAGPGMNPLLRERSKCLPCRSLGGPWTLWYVIAFLKRKKIRTVRTSEEVPWRERMVCTSTVCLAKKIERKTTHSSQEEKARLRTMKITNKQTASKLIDYLDRDRRCWSRFGERNSSEGETETVADSIRSFCCVDLRPKFWRRTSVRRQSFDEKNFGWNGQARARFWARMFLHRTYQKMMIQIACNSQQNTQMDEHNHHGQDIDF